MEKTKSCPASAKTIANNTAVNSSTTEKGVHKCTSAPSSENKTNKENRVNTREEVPKKPLENELELQRRIAEQEAIARAMEKEREKREREQRDREQERYTNAPASKSLIEEIADSDLLNSNFGFFLLFALGILVFVSFKATPDILRDSWNVFYPLSDGTKLINLNFSCTVFPAMLMAAIDLYCFSQHKLMFTYQMNFGNHLISQAFLCYTIYLVNIAFACVVELFGGLNIIEAILSFGLLAILYFLAFSIYALPVALLFSVLAATESDE